MRKTLIFMALLFVHAAVFAEDAKPLNYYECAAIAMENSHEYKIQREKLKQANLARLDALGNVLPSIILSHDRYYGYINEAFADNGWESSISAVQPLFAGLDKIMAISEKDRLAVREEQGLKAAEIILKEKIAAAFFALALSQADFINTQDAVILMAAREKELRQRESLGKSRLSELYSVQSGLAVLQAQLEQSKNSVEKTSDALALAMGTDAAAIIQPVETDECSMKDALSMAGRQPSMLAVEADIEAEGRRVVQKYGDLLPQVDLSVSKSLGKRPYVDGGWVFLLQANWPLFDGGSRVLNIMTQHSKEEALRQQRLSLLKQLSFDIKSKIRDYETSTGRVKTLKDAFEKAEKSFKLIEKDYRYGMATNIEVIQSMTDMINVKKALDAEIITKEKNKVLIEILK